MSAPTAPENAALSAWLLSTLKLDSALVTLCAGRVYASPAPTYATLPYCVVSELPAERDVRSLSGDRMVVPVTTEVTACGAAGDNAAIAPIAARIDALLHGTVAMVAAAPVTMHVRGLRISEIRRPEVLGGITRYAQLGGTYRFRCSPVS